MSRILQDVRFALRQLRKSPGFALTVILTLALGIGANAAVFTLFDQALLRMLPVAHPEELVRFHWKGAFRGSMSSFGGDSGDYFSYPMYKDMRDQNQVFSGMIASDRANAGVSWHNQAESEDVEVVTGNYFDVLGLRPALGRLLMVQDDTAKNSNPIAVLSYGYWKSRFGGAVDVVGQTVGINGHPFTIVGVAPAHFDSAIGGFRPGVFLPITMEAIVMPWRAPLDDLTNHQSAWLTVAARRKPGITIAQAGASMSALWHSLRAAELPLFKTSSALFTRRFLDESTITVIDDSKGFAPAREDLEKPLRILMGMAGLLVLLCAINVATLLLLRAAARTREMSMRYALGARRDRIVTQLLVEGGVLGLAGAAAGIAMASPVALALVRLMTSSDPGAEPYSASVDLRVLGFALAVSLVATIAFSIAPVFHFLKPDLVNSLRQNAGTASRSSQRFRKLAVGAQIALSVLLLGGAGLFVRTLSNLRAADVGFQTGHLATFNLDPSSSGYGEDRTTRIVQDVLATLKRIPGVTDAAGTTDPELTGSTNSSNFSVQGYKAGEEEDMNFEAPQITSGYFASLRQPLLAGREFNDSDTNGQPHVAIVNLAFAKRFYGSPQNAIGKQIAESGGNDAKYDRTIVGVVGDVKQVSLAGGLPNNVYITGEQSWFADAAQSLVLRAKGRPEVLVATVQKAIWAVDKDQPIVRISSMQRLLETSAAQRHFVLVLFDAFWTGGLGAGGDWPVWSDCRQRE